VGLIRPVTFLRASAGLLAFCVVAGCASLMVHNEPVNQPLTGHAAAAIAASSGNTTGSDDLMIGLAFSGGGTRAAAFSFGALSEIERTPVPGHSGSSSLLDRVNFVSGVSGGSVLTAYYGLKKRAALSDFRERFLLRNAEESLTTNVSPLALLRAVGGGVNDTSQFARWLDDNLFEGATFGDMRRTRGRLCRCTGQLSQRVDALHQAARWQSGRQFRTFGLHHCALIVRYSVWSAHTERGGQAAPRYHHHSGCWARALG